MASSYKSWIGLQSHPLGNEALRLREAYSKPCRLSPLVAMSDPIRTENILEWAENLPEHCAIIYRYNSFDPDIARNLRLMTNKRNQQFLVRNEIYSLENDGVHFKRDTCLNEIKNIRKTHPNALLSLAAIKEGEYATPIPALDALLVSAIFQSQSPSAGTAIGVEALKRRVQKYSVPIYALGGVNIDTVKHLRSTGIAGIAAIGGLTKESNMSKSDLIITKEDTAETITFKAYFPDESHEAELNLSKVSNGLFNAHHTGVPKAMGGKGVGTALVKAMSEDAWDNNYKVIPSCPFIAVWFKRKPEWAEMAAEKPELFRK